MAKHNQIGEKGEQLAVDYFQQKGYQILHKNWRKGRNEIDIIARWSDSLHFIEVKTRTFAGNIPPEHAVNKKKLQGLMKAAAAFLIENHKDNSSIQFDVLSISLLPKIEILLIEDVYLYPI
jgi:putative endonuclease